MKKEMEDDRFMRQCEAIRKRMWTKLVVITCILLAACHILRAKGRACRKRAAKRRLTGEE